MKQFYKTLSAITLCMPLLLPLQSAKAYTLPQGFEEETYMEYEHREPCQFYKVIPSRLLGITGCETLEEDTIIQGDGAVRLLPVIATYVIYFGFDKSDISSNQFNVINQLSSELNTYNPSQVTVVGHTDTSGSVAYNKILSEKRAAAVSNELTKRKIANFYLDEGSVGEYDLAVETPDGVRLPENRRVVIQFRK